MQFGFQDALYDSATVIQQNMRGDLFIVHKHSDALWRTQPFSRRRLLQALAVSGVKDVAPLYAAFGDWKQPWTHKKRAILVIGFDPAQPLMDLPGLSPLLPLLRARDTVAFDVLSRKEFGPVGPALERGESIRTEVSNRAVEVVGGIRCGASFAADGNLVVSEQNFHRLVNARDPSMVDIGVIFLAADADRTRVKEAVQEMMPEDVRIFDRGQLIAWEKVYWETGSPIGFIFSLGAAMGFVVGVVIVYQVLYTQVANHIAQYATLKAIGYRHGFLVLVVAGAAGILCLLGFVPGAAISAGLYALTREAASLPMTLEFDRLASVFVLIAAMCFASGLLALRKLRSANPADVF
jgi:putative ABC transport system permease protein